jgi:repressor LexA
MSDLGNKETMSKNIKHYMKLHSKGRNDICRDLKFKYSTFSDWVNGNKYPRIDNIEKLANYFNIKKSDLIENKDKSNYFNLIPLKKAVPVLGQISAGHPILAVEEIEGYQPVMHKAFYAIL